MTLGEVTTAAPSIIPPTETAIEALGLMQDSGFRHVPVVDLGHRFRLGAARRAAISSVPAATWRCWLPWVTARRRGGQGTGGR
jgi:hypothetical protein